MYLLIRFIFISFFGKILCQRIANVKILSASGSNVTGDVVIRQLAGAIHVTGEIIGLFPGKHGFHIHQNPDIGNECRNAGGHFNPFSANHGGQRSTQRHVGDLGNIEARSDGTAEVSIIDSMATLNHLSNAFVGNLSIVIHAGADDLGLGGNAESLRTGNAGARVGCGRIIMENSDRLRSTQRIIQPSRITQQDVKNIKAVVQIYPGSQDISGLLEIKPHNEGVHILGNIYGLSLGHHGFHVHEKGELGNACVDAGGHFNPFKRNHGSPDKSQRHVGDLGNVYSDAAGFSHINIYDDHASLYPLSPAYIGNRAIVVHVARDDLGLGNNRGSLKTGNAGARAGCGKISVTIEPQTKQLLFEDQSLQRQSVVTTRARVAIMPSGQSSVRGDLTLEENVEGVTITGRIEGLTPGLHGFHVHEFGSLDNNCVAAGGHFNPFKRNHGSPSSSDRHVGDLGNIFAEENGVALVQIKDKHISMDPGSMSYIGNRAIVVHSGADDFGNGRNKGSLKTGNAGSRVACGIISIEDTFPGNEKIQIEQLGPIDPGKITFPRSILPDKQSLFFSKEEQSQETAFANIVPGKGRSVRGRIELEEDISAGGVRIIGRIEGLTPGLHGFHIHQIGSLENRCVGAGSHFNPFEQRHGHPDSFERHAGDLGNIFADSNGVADIRIYDEHISLRQNNPAYIGGRAFVVHEDRDDLGKGNNAESLKTGNAGSRVGCGIIRMSKFLEREEEQQTFRAMAVFVPGRNKNVEGKLTLNQEYGGVLVRGLVAGLSPGLHGFHIHRSGYLSNDCSDAGGHFNPFQKTHGSPSVDDRHVGDLGNVKANGSGVAVINLFDDHVSLNPESPAFVGDRSFVVHALSDDLGTTGNDESLRTGNAGSRDGCANIMVQRTESIVRPNSNDNNFSPPQFVKLEVPAVIDHRSGVVPEQQPKRIVMPGEQIPVQDVQPTIAEPRHATGFHHQTFSGQVEDLLAYQLPSLKPEQVVSEHQLRRLSVQSLSARELIAVAEIVPGKNKVLSGKLRFLPSDDHRLVTITGVIHGLTPGYHGFHVHEKGQLGNECLDAGGHFNPFKRSHGAPRSKDRHVGDLGNIFADNNGIASIRIVDDRISLDSTSEAFIGGRTIVIHADPDDLGFANTESSRTTGNAGPRSGCARIILHPLVPHYKINY